MSMIEEKQTEEAREVMPTPTEFRDGFGWRAIVGALFLGFVMMPGSIYMNLVAGQTLGAAAEWVTIILFLEAARRSYQVLSRQEIYVLFYVAAAVGTGIAVGSAGPGAHQGIGGPFQMLMWLQYFVRSPAAEAFREQIPTWAAPPPGSTAFIKRTFFHSDWTIPILLLVLGQVMGRVAWFGWGYTLFRLTSDMERLPFPMAPVAAQGATALAEVSAKTETWRWRLFSIGAMGGLAFGAIYVGIPTVTGTVFVRPIHLLPIPFIDFTHGTEKILPATPTGIGTSLGSVFAGFVLPFWVVVGQFAAAVVTMIANPILYRYDVLVKWMPGMDTLRTQFANSLDFWLSFGIGTGVAIGLVGLYKTGVSMWRSRREGAFRFGLGKPPPGRGDIPLPLAVFLMFLSTTTYVLLCWKLVPGFPIIFFIFFGYLWTPFESFISARMVGMTAAPISFPFLREATFIFSGYRGAAIWFAPIPYSNYGPQVQRFREIELTGTKITSIIKAEVLLIMPVIFFTSFLFWSLIWKMGPVPSEMYPFAMKMWPFNAWNQGLWITGTTEERGGRLMQALKPSIIGSGLSFGLVTYSILSYFRWPVMLIYGFLMGTGQLPHFAFPTMGGAILGRYYLAKRLGLENWRRYAPVLLAGFSCGSGLIGMCSVAFALLQLAVSQLPY